MTLYAWIAVAVLAFGSGWWVRGVKSDADAAKVRDTAQETQQLRERASRVTVKEIDHATVQRQGAAQALDTADRDELYRLRLAAAAADDAGDSAPACQPLAERFSECRSALAESADAAAEGAALARKLETQAAGLRDYATGLGRLPVKP